MKKILLSAASLLLLLGSCSQNEWDENVLSNGENVVSATIEGQPNSRLSVTHNETTNVFSLAWSTGDSFKVFGDDNASAVYNWNTGDEFTLKTGDTAPETPKYAVYPNSETNAPTIASDVMTMTLSATPSVENINLPMWAGAPTETNYAFKHLAAALQFTLNDIPAGYNQLIVEASHPISGTFTATLNTTEPKLTSNSTADADKKVTVSFTAATGSSTLDKVFYIPLPAETYTSLEVSVSNGTETKELKSWTNLEVVRGKMYYTTATVDATTIAAVNEALANAGEKATTVNLTAAVDASAGVIDIPDAAKNVTMDFGVAPTTSESAPLTINQNEKATSGDATGVLNIKMPAAATDLYAEINTPTTTATLNGGSYKKVTATTATNTLIVKNGTTIESLIISGGNVVIEEGATVTTITNTANSTIAVNDATALTAAIAAGGKVVLAADITLTTMTTIEKDLNLDLAGHTLNFTVAEPDYSWPCLKNTAITTITTSVAGGKIVSNDVGVQNNGTLTINCGIESASSAINNVHSGKVTIEGGSYSSTAGNPWALIAVNGWGEGNPEVTINGGTFTSSFTNLSFNNGAKGAINGGTFNSTNGWYNLFVGGSEGGCVVTYDAEACSFTTSGINVLVEEGTAANKVNGTDYTTTEVLLNYVSTLEELTTAIGRGGNVTLAADITLTTMTTIEKDLSLDLAGHTLNFTVAKPDYSWPCLKNTAITTITTSVAGGKIVSNDVGVQNNGTLTINCGIESASSAINNVYSGKVTIEGGSYSSTAGNPWALIAVNGWGEGNPEVTINGGTFTSSFTNLSFNKGSKGTINGGTFTCTGNWYNIYAGENSQVTYDQSECSFSTPNQSIYVDGTSSVTSF